ncbi:hypothetical protein AAG747_25395 [Rapidithrix thailandica]|uniref:Uncharacterized protein n=1 Tax=Rapidithrix thailandica TaxID=413964 RepID=A0AAW9SFK1_9BACT
MSAGSDIFEIDGKTGSFAKNEQGKLTILFDGKAYLREINGIISEIKIGKELANDVNKLKGINPREIWQTEVGKQIKENIRNNKYPSAMVQASKDGTGTVRPKYLQEVLPDTTTKAVIMQNIKKIGGLGVKGGGLIAFFFPFITTYFSEETRKELVNVVMEDINNEGINVIAHEA